MSTTSTSPPDVHKNEKNSAEYFCPIFIPSKGRYHSERGTASLLIRDRVPFTLVVQAEEHTLYEQLVDRLVKKWWDSDDDATYYNNNGNDNTINNNNNNNNNNSTGNGGGEEQMLVQNDDCKHISFPPSQQSKLTLPPSPCILAKQCRRKGDAADVRRTIKVESLPLSDQGVSYVRNHILKELVPKVLAAPPSSVSLLSKTPPREAQWFWVLDDDIQRFHRSRDGKNYTITPRQLFAEVYARIQRYHGSLCDMNTITIFSLEYARFAYTYRDCDISLNSYNNIASLFRYDLIPPGCVYRFRIREDYDFTLQLISHGLTTARFRNLSFDVPRMAETAGGMTNYYKTQKEDIRLQNKLFVQTWPAVAQECIKGKGALEREDIRVRWDLLHPRKNSNPGATLRSRVPLKARPQNQVLLPPSLQVGGISKTTVNEVNNRHVRVKQPLDTAQGKKKKNKKKSREEEDEYEYIYEQQQRELQRRGTIMANSTCLADATHPRRVERRVRNETAPAWKGYALESWRDLTIEEAESLHLHLIPADKLRVGQTVAVVPPMFYQNPSVVEAVLIEKHVKKKRRKGKAGNDDNNIDDINIEWSVVARGLPLLSVSRCYEVPAVGVDAAAAAVDAFFNTIEEEEEKGEGKKEEM